MYNSLKKSFSFYYFIVLLLISMPLFGAYAADNTFRNSGKILLKSGAQISLPDGSLTNFLPSFILQSSSTKLINLGFGFNASAAFFVNDYAAIAGGMGFNSYKNSQTTLNYIQQSYNAPPLDFTSNNQTGVTSTTYGSIYNLPLSLLAQLYIIPFGAIRPYLGFGYQYNILLTDSSFFDIDCKFGMIAQFGIDILMEDDVVYFVQLEKSFLNTTINYINSTNKSTSVINLDSLSLSFGVGFQF